MKHVKKQRKSLFLSLSLSRLQKAEVGKHYFDFMKIGYLCIALGRRCWTTGPSATGELESTHSAAAGHPSFFHKEKSILKLRKDKICR